MVRADPKWRCRLSILAMLALSLCARGETQVPPQFEDRFADQSLQQWLPPANPSDWKVKGDALLRLGRRSDNALWARLEPVADALVEMELQVSSARRRVFGVALRGEDDSYLLVRYYDQPRALEVLSYKGGDWSRVGKRSPEINVVPGNWYRLRVAAIGDRLFASLTPRETVQSEWQLSVRVDRQQAGRIGIVGHDDTRMDVDAFRVWSKHALLAERRQAQRKQKEQELADLRSQLQLFAVPDNTPIQRDGKRLRRIRLVCWARGDRQPVGGRLTIEMGGTRRERSVTGDDFEQGALSLFVPDVDASTQVSLAYETEVGKLLKASLQIAPAKPKAWRDYVRVCLDTLIKHGRDDYGKQASPLFMAVLDADALRSPSRPLRLDAPIRLEGRIHRRGERGSNLWYDQGLLKALYRMSDLTGDSRYANAADNYIRHFFDNCQKQSDPAHVFLNGMPAWGTHVYWDCFTDAPAGDGGGNGPHEILVFRAEWEAMHRVHPTGVQQTIDGIWKYHVVDKSTGLHNRHDDARQGCDFAFSGSSFVHAFAFMFRASGHPKYLHQAKTVASWHANNRNPKTKLTADCPGLSRRYDGQHCFTTVCGPHAMSLLEAYNLTEDTYFLDLAIDYIKAYDRFGWDDRSGTYWAMLRLDGTPVPDRKKGTGYGAYAPYGHVNVWRTTFYSYEFTLSAAQAAVQAYAVTERDGKPDEALLKIAKRWGAVVENALPARTGRRWKQELEQAMPRARQARGVYAEDYGRAISLFVHLHRATRQARYLKLARTVAQDAVEKLYHNGLFLGHPAKPYYETTNGVGLLLVALLELDSPQQPLGGAL